MRMATSDGPTMPRSPCTLSTGWRNVAGVPVDVSVAAILRPMSPDLPTPATITRPLHAASKSIAAANGAPKLRSMSSSASRSMRNTRRPRSTRSMVRAWPRAVSRRAPRDRARARAAIRRARAGAARRTRAPRRVRRPAPVVAAHMSRMVGTAFPTATGSATSRRIGRSGMSSPTNAASCAVDTVALEHASRTRAACVLTHPARRRPCAAPYRAGARSPTRGR